MYNYRTHFCSVIIVISAIFFFFCKDASAVLKWVELAGSATGGGVSNSIQPSLSPSLALDTFGRPNIAWQEDFDIFFAYYDGNSWVGYANSNTDRGHNRS